MPKAPAFAPTTSAMPGAVFSPLAKQLGELADQICPLHVGDTWLEPWQGARASALEAEGIANLDRYAPTPGIPELRQALADTWSERNGLDCQQESVLVSTGATGALAAALGAVLSPGDEVLVLAPYWPLIPGIVQAFRGVAVEVPFFDRVRSADDAVAVVEAQRSDRTVALYVSSPSNPTGRVIPEAQLAALAEWAREQNLWLISDEVYERLVYEGRHVSPGRFAPERSLSVFSFSKAYAMAGYRVGALAAPPEVVTQALKISTHTSYAAPTAFQWAALRALQGAEVWLEDARAQYAQVGREAARRLGLPAPEGATFLFFDVADALDERGLWGFLADCVDDGVALAPGPSCGAGYDTWVRLCFTAAPPDAVLAAVDRLAARLGRGPGAAGSIGT